MQKFADLRGKPGTNSVMFGHRGTAAVDMMLWTRRGFWETGCRGRDGHWQDGFVHVTATPASAARDFFRHELGHHLFFCNLSPLHSWPSSVLSDCLTEVPTWHPTMELLTKPHDNFSQD